MEVTFQYLQVRAVGGEASLQSAFGAPGLLQVSGVLTTTFHDVESVAEAGRLTYELAQQNLTSDLPDGLNLWGVEYFYQLNHPSHTALMIREMHPDDGGFFISRLDAPFDDRDEMSDRFLTRIENSPYCYRAGWTDDYLQVQLSATGLAYDRDLIHRELLKLYM